MHPNGQLPAYEWNFSDTNPPVHAWAALRVFELDGSRDFAFLERMLHKLALNFGWWINRRDSEGRNVFGGGFLGLDNVSPINRSMLPPNEMLEQADATGWMARYCLDLLRIALVLAERDATYADMAIAFATRFAAIATAIDELWDEGDGFYYDRLRFSDGSSTLLRVHSAVGLIPLLAAAKIDADQLERLPALSQALDRFEREKPQLARAIARDASGRRILALVPPDRLARLLTRVFDENEFLSPYGLRSLSRHHREFPFTIDVNGMRATVDYEPAESTTPLFGGNSNWRGPVWMPLNYLSIEGLRAYHAIAGDNVRVECRHGQATTSPSPRLRTSSPAASRRSSSQGTTAAGPSSARTERCRTTPTSRARPLPRVLPRRDRSGARRLASDRVDRARRDALTRLARPRCARGAVRAAGDGGLGPGAEASPAAAARCRRRAATARRELEVELLVVHVQDHVHVGEGEREHARGRVVPAGRSEETAVPADVAVLEEGVAAQGRCRLRKSISSCQKRRSGSFSAARSQSTQEISLSWHQALLLPAACGRIRRRPGASARPARQEERREVPACRSPQGLDRGVVGLALDAAVPAEVVVRCRRGCPRRWPRCACRCRRRGRQA